MEPAASAAAAAVVHVEASGLGGAPAGCAPAGCAAPAASLPWLLPALCICSRAAAASTAWAGEGCQKAASGAAPAEAVCLRRLRAGGSGVDAAGGERTASARRLAAGPPAAAPEARLSLRGGSWSGRRDVRTSMRPWRGQKARVSPWARPLARTKSAAGGAEGREVA